ncbi:MFS transporter [Cytobacillus sp. Sa5YUA1]|uniref:MFS transporter n=1 Tax=Cytobacillus stercorigallinarum TaxID=2762240 RepID=A0ABR8QVN8_9BACI|nr:MFS transporter [Cytobacillus stercorigallinarum]MBD7939596.1 MFS transporter [Cytobacillus stercorigallinarum]
MVSQAAIKKNLVLFLLAKVVIVLGSNIYSFAIGLYVLSVTGSAVNFSITLLLTILPRILLAPLAGTLSDRWNRKRIIITTNFACALWITVICVLFIFVTQDIWLLYLATCILSIINTFYSSAVMSSIYNMVGPDHLQKAMSLNQAVVSFSGILGPILGGVFFGLLPLSSFMIMNICGFFISGLASLFINYYLFAEKTPVQQTGSIGSELKEGLSFVKKQTLLRKLIFVSIWVNFWFAVFPIALPYLVLTIRDMPSYQFGIIEGSFAVGMLVMSTILSLKAEIKRKSLSLFVGMLCLGVLLALLGVPQLPMFLAVSNQVIFVYLLIIVLLLAAAIMIINIPVMVLIQKSTKDEYRGRVMAILETGASAATPLGFILFGLFLEWLPMWVMMVVAGVSIIGFILYQARNKHFFRLLQQTDQPKVMSIEA